MIWDLYHPVTRVRHLGGLKLRVTFHDGFEGDVDLRRVLGRFPGVWAPLKDPAYVAKARVSSLQETLVWPNGTDIDPLVLYCAARALPIPGMGPPATQERGKGSRSATKRRVRRTA